jgi:cell wall-associated NlpC family hydrolase
LPKVNVDPPPRSTAVDQAIAYALLQVGKPYVHGGTGPNNFDCSGLTQRAWAAAGISIPRTSGQQFSATIHIDMTDALPGDLIFYGQSGAQHVAMYIGFGLIVEAANPSKGVVISPISTPWHNNNFGGIGRIRAPLSPATQP